MLKRVILRKGEDVSWFGKRKMGIGLTQGISVLYNELIKTHHILYYVQKNFSYKLYHLPSNLKSMWVLLTENKLWEIMWHLKLYPDTLLLHIYISKHCQSWPYPNSSFATDTYVSSVDSHQDSKLIFKSFWYGRIIVMNNPPSAESFKAG